MALRVALAARLFRTVLPVANQAHSLRAASMASVDRITLPVADDLHVHLRQESMMHMVVPQIRRGGVGRVLVMPNLKPPVSSVDYALRYKRELEAVDPSVTYLMTLYLGPDVTPAEIAKAADAGVVGVKSYPRGVTTNSESGIESYTVYYPVFKAMEERGMILNIHGEVPSDHSKDICVLNAEENFLKHLEQLHADFPRLRIVLEHVTTAAAVAKVKSLGPTVAATITAHHLELTVDDWAGRNHNFCKPVAKYPHDREALRAVVREGHDRFFLGSDSAPHARTTKETAVGCAGVFTQPYLLPYLAHTFETLGCLGNLRKFACENGRKFYGLAEATGTVTLVRSPLKVADEIPYGKGEGAVVPFRAGETLSWQVEGTAQ